MNLIQYFRLIDIQAKLNLKANAAQLLLGYIWWLLEPLLFVAVFYVVFAVILDSGKTDYMVFLMCGKLPFMWFSKSVSNAANSIVSNSGLIGKIDLPKTMFPMVKIQEALYRQLAVFVLLFIYLLANEYPASALWLWLVPIAVVQYFLIVACSLIAASLVCFMRDFTLIVSLGMTFLMFTSGVFWDPRSLTDPAMTELILTWNPVALLLDSYRQVLMHQQAPEVGLLAANLLVFGVLIFVVARLMGVGSQRLALKALS